MRYKLLELGLRTQGRDVFRIYRQLLKEQYNSLEENERKQRDKLSKLLLHAYKYVPYYKKILKEQEVIKERRVFLENFDKIPVLTKEQIRKNFNNLKSTDPGFNLRNPFLNTSGGSTGEPVQFYQDNNVWSRGMAIKWLYYSFITEYPCKLLKLWGSQRDVLEGSIGFKSKMQNLIANRVLLDCFQMNEEKMFSYLKKINRFKPDIIEAYVQSIYEFANFVDRKKLKIHQPKGIITSAGTLYPEMQKKIAQVFGCHVYNRYGTREVGDIACSCSEGDNLHINNLNLYVEVLDNNYKAVKPGELGKVYATTLDNYSMPLIRYDLGDIATISNKKACACERGLPLLKRVEGREMSIFKTRDGGLVPGEFFIHFIGVVFNKGLISKFQVIQESLDLIVIKVVPIDKDGLKVRKKAIEDSIRKVMGEDCKIRWEYVKEIKPLSSGKYLYTVSKVK